MRKVTAIGLVVLATSAPAAAAPQHIGHPVLPGPLPQPRALHRLLVYPRTLVELDRLKGPTAADSLRRAGGRLIAPRLQLWRVPTDRALGLLPSLMHRGLVRSVTPDEPLGPDFASALFAPASDPLGSSEWWIGHIGADRWVPPGPGIPLTVIDSGLDISHEEFNHRQNTTLLNRQTTSEDESELHGTAVASVAAAPANGVGLVGVYPRARLRSWDISPNSIPTLGDELQALSAVSARRRGVVNLSFGGTTRFAVEEHVIMAAFGSGSLIVASAGNLRELLSIPEYPANYPHVLTVGATDQNDAVTVFSSASPGVDLAAPGLDIPVAAPTRLVPAGYTTLSGTSFSAPLVSGAAAALWTARPKLSKTQVFELLRRSARDVGDPGRDPDTGFGILDLPTASQTPAPRADPQEPNEDIYLVKPNGLFRAGHPPLTSRAHPDTKLGGRLDVAEDPGDVYRLYVPARGRLVVSVRPTANLSLEAWGPRTTTVFERGEALRRDLLAVSAKPGSATESLVIRGRAKARFVYLDVFLTRGVASAAYTLTVSSGRP